MTRCRILIFFTVVAPFLAFDVASAIENLARGRNGLVYGSDGANGIVVLNISDGAVVEKVSRPSGFDGIHDVAVEGDLLFALDGSGGSVGVFNLAASGRKPEFVSGSRQEVSVGPYAGVSAGGGKMVVSGGTGTMSVYSYTAAGALTRLTNSIDLGTGQPDVLVDRDGSYAYVSTDFSGNVNGSGFGITTVDLNSDDLSEPSLERVGLRGAGFTDGEATPANFPIESAIAGSRLLVAHGGGLSVLSLANRARPALVSTTRRDFGAVNVDADGDVAVAVGGGSGPRAMRTNLAAGTFQSVDLPSGSKPATAVAVSGDSFIIAAGGSVYACKETCSKASAGSGSSSGSGGNGSSSGGGDKDVCVEEEFLLSRQIKRENLLHKGSFANVLCPGNGLPCGTQSHVVRFGGDYVTYKELCASGKVRCAKDRKVVNGVSMRYARYLCGNEDEHCVVPHVMRTKFGIERAVVRALHRTIVG